MAHWESLGESDEWYTPKYIFDALDCCFDLDVASPETGPKYVPAKKLVSSDSLVVPWVGFVWMNPTFGGRNGLVPWLAKFTEHRNGIALVPDRTSAPWFQSYARRMDAILFLPKVKFERPDGSVGKSPSCGTVLMGIGPSAVCSLEKAQNLGWFINLMDKKT